MSDTVVKTTDAQRAVRTHSLGQLREQVTASRTAALKAAGLADRLGARELHLRLLSAITTLDDAFEAIIAAHLQGSEIEMPEPPRTSDAVVRDLIYSITQALHGHSDPEALRRITAAVERAERELAR